MSGPPTPAPTSAPAKKNPFPVSEIPPFKKGPINYAAAAGSKSAPSPAAVNGNDATATVIGSTGGSSPAAQAIAAVGNSQRKESVKVDGVTVPPARVSDAQGGANANVAFGNVADKNATLSSSPAAPPAFNGSNPAKSFGTVPAAASGPSERLNIHSFFTGGGSPQPAAPQLPPNAGMHANTQPFNPRVQPRGIPPAFVPGQAGAAPFNPANAYPSSPYSQPQQIPSKPQSFGGTPSQNIPNGSPYGGPGGQPQQPGSRNGSFVGSPNMQPRLGGGPQGPNNRNSFNNATSPRLANAGLPPQSMGYQGQQWQPGQQYQQPYQPYYPQQGGYIPPPAQYQSGPAGAPLPVSGSSTPSTGVRTPAVSAPAGVPPSPSPVHALTPTGATFVPSNFSSPVPASAQLPHAPHLGHSQHSSYSGPGTPLRAPAAGAGTPTSFSPHVQEFKPSGIASDFVLTPRKSAAIQIRKPTDLKPKPAAEPKAASPAPSAPEKKDEAAEAKKVEEEAAAKKKAEDDAREKAEKLAKEEKEKAEAEKAEAEKAEAEKAEKEAADKKAAEEAEAEAAAASAKAATEAEEKEKADKAAAEVAEKEQAETESKKTDESTTDAAQTLADARSALPTPPASLPAKPVNGATEATPAAEAEPAAPTGPSPLLTAKAIEDLAAVTYPKEIQPVRADLNVSAEAGRFRYDREFLMQFMAVCVAKPDNLPDLEAIGMVDAGGDGSMSRHTSFGGSRRSSAMGPPAVPNRSGSVGGAFGRSISSGGVGGFSMGNFGQGSGLTSEARFAASTRNASGAFGGRSGGSMSRTSSQSGMSGFVPAGGNQRIRSDRGKRRDDGKSGGGSSRGPPGKDGHVTGQGFEGATLEKSENRWVPNLPGAAVAVSEENSPEMVQRKVKALLNKLTLERFDSISEQILAWADKSIDETDGRILRQVIALIFEKATDEANWSEMYARLCRKLMEKVSPKVTDENVKAADGSFVSGGALFRKYLLNRCQEDYEAGWKQKEASAAAAASKAADDNAKKEANEAAEAEAKEKGGDGPSGEAELLSDEYYAAQKAKRRGLGLVRFIGELFRLSMLTERIMHECIKKLLANTESPEEEDVESLCRLMTTVGKLLDNPKAKQHMDIYFTRMKQIEGNPKVPSRMRFMIVDVVDLRLSGWTPRNAASGPKLISEIHADAQKAQEESARRTASSSGKGLPHLHNQLSRPNSRRGQGRDFGVAAPGADGWSAVPQRPAKAGDLSSFGKIRDSSSNVALAPGGAFAKRQATKEAARPATPSNPFALLEAQQEAAAGPQRQRLVLAPRTKPLEGEEEEEEGEEPKAADEEEEEDDGAIDPNASSLSRAEAERRAGNSVKEFYAVKNIQEGVLSVEALPVEYRGLLVAQFGDSAVDRKADDVNLTRQLFAELVAKDVVSHDKMIESLTGLFKGLVDLAIDVPGIYNFASQLLLGAGASREEMVQLAEKMQSEEEDEEEVEFAREKLLTAFDKLVQA